MLETFFVLFFFPLMKLFCNKAFVFSYKARINLLHFSNCLFLLSVVIFVLSDSGSYYYSKNFNRQLVAL